MNTMKALLVSGGLAVALVVGQASYAQGWPNSPSNFNNSPYNFNNSV
jgi:hypothetical protein